jgi:prepilin-type N-terminal cleavage/methylation domain-containing protein
LVFRRCHHRSCVARREDAQKMTRIQQRTGHWVSRDTAGFTLVEVLVAIAIVSLVAIGSIQTITLAKLSSRQAYEEQIALAFLQDYIENVAGLEFDDINLSPTQTFTLLDGLRTLPGAYSAGTWITIALDSNDELAFPELRALAKGGIPPRSLSNTR